MFNEAAVALTQMYITNINKLTCITKIAISFYNNVMTTIDILGIHSLVK